MDFALKEASEKRRKEKSNNVTSISLKKTKEIFEYKIFEYKKYIIFV